MIEAEKPQGLILTAAVMSLFTLARDLIPHGIPILMEKPPGTSLAEVDELVGLAQAHRTSVTVALNRRFYSVYHQALERLGGFDAVTRVSVEWSEDPARMLDLGHPLELVPLLTFANSIHGLDLMVFWGGEPETMAVWGRNLDPSRARQRWQMGAQGTSSKGARLHFESTWDAPASWRVVVEAPGVRIVSAPLESAVIARRGQPTVELQPSEADRSFKPGFFEQARAFLRVVRSETGVVWPAASLPDCFPSMRLAEALTRACEQA
jgi:predicted dehydrogenase